MTASGAVAGEQIARLVDAAARAHHDSGQARRMDAARLRPDGRPWDYADLTPSGQASARAYVAPIVNTVIEQLASWEVRP